MLSKIYQILLIMTAVLALNNHVNADDQRSYKLIHNSPSNGAWAIALSRIREPLSQSLRRPLIIESYVGGHGTLAINKYQGLDDPRAFIVLGPTVHTILPKVQKVDYTVDNLEPLLLLAITPWCYAVRGDTKNLDFKTFLADTKGGFYGSQLNFSMENLLMMHINRQENLGQTMVNYKSHPDIARGILQGDVHWAIVPRWLCSSKTNSSTVVISLESVSEKYDLDYWFSLSYFGLFAKKNTDSRIKSEFVDAFIDAWWKNQEYVNRNFAFPNRVVRGEEFRKHVDAFAQRIAPLLKSKND
jgi:tripartite-type tricarboxylate transporter receptor subunit TctC